ncbi:MAG: hypothetical protein Q8M96_13640, partial [Rubrivivax sp.]|nr:hypothetical protein [Rubrivivax sp.]
MRPPPVSGWSLVRRLSGGVALIAVLSLASQAWVMSLWLRPLLHEVGTLAAEQAVQLQVALQAVPPAARPALAQQLSNDRLQVSRSEPEGVHAMVPPPPPGMQALAEQ